MLLAKVAAAISAAVAILIGTVYLTPQLAVRVEPTCLAAHLPRNFCGLFGAADVGDDDTGALREAFDEARPSTTTAPTPTASIPPAGPSYSSEYGMEPVEEEGSAAPVVPERPKTTVTVTIRPDTPAITIQFADIAVKVTVEQLVAPAPGNPRSSVKEDQTTCDRPSDFGLVILNIVLGACVWWFRGVWGSWWCAIWRCSQAEDVGRPAPREGPGLCHGARLALLQARDGCGRCRSQASTGEGVAALRKRRASDPGSWSVALRATRDGGVSVARGQDEPHGDANWAPPPHLEGATPIAEPESAPDSPRVVCQEAEGPLDQAVGMEEAPPASEGEPAVEGDSPAEPASQQAEPADDFPPAEGPAPEDPSSSPSGDEAESEGAARLTSAAEAELRIGHLFAHDFVALAMECRPRLVVGPCGADDAKKPVAFSEQDEPSRLGQCAYERWPSRRARLAQATTGTWVTEQGRLPWPQGARRSTGRRTRRRAAEGLLPTGPGSHVDHAGTRLSSSPTEWLRTEAKWSESQNLIEAASQAMRRKDEQHNEDSDDEGAHVLSLRRLPILKLVVLPSPPSSPAAAPSQLRRRWR
ncbi:MAG: hypothetical protein M1826_000818 [Phylliscum demangeonii]|nr:MAG: hypothetical protein M1826_000818 [Phylliscum demangeonii]